MALKLTKSTVHGFVADDAYHRVENVRINQKQGYQLEETVFAPVFMISFSVRSYRQNDGAPFFAESNNSCVYELDAANPLAQAYAYLKTLPEFVGAEDC
jgi:hypothetical protein